MNGAVELLEFSLKDDPDAGGSVGMFYALNSNKEDENGVWYNTEFYQTILGGHRIVIGGTGGDDPIFIDMNDRPPSINIFHASSYDETVKVTNSFEEFIDMLDPFVDPGE